MLCACFPGTGKSYCYNNDNNPCLIILDSDSSKFDKAGFPENYIQHIKENIGKVDIIFISTHEEVRSALVENSLDFTLIYPEKILKNEYIQRYKKEVITKIS